MKFKTYIEDARDNLIASLTHINDINRPKQTDVVERTNKAIKEIDRLLEVVNRKPYTPDPAQDHLKKIWDEMANTPVDDYKLMVLRISPQVIKNIKICGYIKTFSLPITVPDIIEEIGSTHGGGQYQIKIVDGSGRYVKSKTFEISGLPKIPEKNEPTSLQPSAVAHATAELNKIGKKAKEAKKAKAKNPLFP